MLDSMIRILVCSDLRPSADGALAQALRLVQRLHAELHLCYISRWSPLPVGAGSLRPGRQRPTPQRAEAHLRALVLRLGWPLGAEPQIHVRIGRPVERILSLIQEIRPHLVAICAHPQVPYRRPMLGSVARQLAVRSPIPLLIVPAAA
ncbi:MAG: universal stress protein [Myxococcales bacterium]|nr:universal stress protein [Myxococcales bacterium]